MEKHYKYITYRESRKTYQVKILVAGKQVVRQAKTLDEALNIRADLFKRNRLDKSLLVDIANTIKPKIKAANNLTLFDMRNWYETCKKPYIELQTQRRYNNIIQNVVIPVLGTFYATIINRDTIQCLVQSLLDGRCTGNKIAISSIKIVVLLIKQYYDYLINDCHYNINNPCHDIKYPKQQVNRKEALTDDEVRRVINYIRQHNKGKYFLYKLYFETGCRRGELLGLTWRYVDFKASKITIQRTLINNPYTYGYELKDTPKNRNSVRDIYINDDDIRHLKFLYEYAKYKDKDFSLDSIVFLNAERKPYCPKKISQTFKQAAIAVGINKNVSLHSTRHTFATRMIDAAVPIPTIQLLGGWGKPDTLLRIYAHADALKAREAIKRVGWQL